MICPHPISIPRPNGRGAKDRINVPCGRCAFCLINRREDWTIRLIEEAKNYLNTSFITLTYADENLKYGSGNMATLDKQDLQLFFKRLRKKKPFRYYSVGEYGTKTFRPHYHIIAFGLDRNDIGLIDSAWSIGNITVTDINIRRLVYTTKYHVNRGVYPTGCAPPFALMSRKPGIGFSYVDKMREYHEGDIERAHYQLNEYKKKLPRYFKNKLYTDVERQRIADTFASDMFTMDKINEFKAQYPNESYFKHVMHQLRNYELKYKDKINFSNTI